MVRKQTSDCLGYASKVDKMIPLSKHLVTQVANDGHTDIFLGKERCGEFT